MGCDIWVFVNSVHTYVFHRKGYCKFFLTFADKHLFFSFTGPFLADNKIPQLNSCLACWTSTNQEFVFVPYRGSHYFCHISNPLIGFDDRISSIVSLVSSKERYERSIWCIGMLLSLAQLSIDFRCLANL